MAGIRGLVDGGSKMKTKRGRLRREMEEKDQLKK
jgi:hypothetical protein